MALTITPVFSHLASLGDRWMNVVKVDLDSSYPSGGYTLKPTDLGFAATVDDEFHVEAISKLGYVFWYDHTNQILHAYQQDYDLASADAPLVEVGTGTDLHTVTGIRVSAIGRFHS